MAVLNHHRIAPMPRPTRSGRPSGRSVLLALGVSGAVLSANALGAFTPAVGTGAIAVALIALRIGVRRSPDMGPGFGPLVVRSAATAVVDAPRASEVAAATARRSDAA